MKNQKKATSRAYLWMLLLAIVCAYVSYSNYFANGATIYNKGLLSEPVLQYERIGIFVAAGCFILDLIFKKEESFIKTLTRFAKYLVYILFLLSFLQCIVTEFNFIGNVFVGTDPVEPQYITNYLITVVTILGASILALVSASMQKGQAYREE